MGRIVARAFFALSLAACSGGSEAVETGGDPPEDSLEPPPRQASDGPLSVTASALPQQGPVPLVTTLTCEVEGNDSAPLVHLWELGEGEARSAPEIEWTWKEPGTWVPCCVAWRQDRAGGSVIDCVTITAEPRSELSIAELSLEGATELQVGDCVSASFLVGNEGAATEAFAVRCVLRPIEGGGDDVTV